LDRVPYIYICMYACIHTYTDKHTHRHTHTDTQTHRHTLIIHIYIRMKCLLYKFKKTHFEGRYQGEPLRELLDEVKY